jgi:hypothetical protein
VAHSAAEIENAVIQQICLLLTDKQRLLEFLSLATPRRMSCAPFQAAENLAGRFPSQPVADQRLLLLAIVSKVASLRGSCKPH